MGSPHEDFSRSLITLGQCNPYGYRANEEFLHLQRRECASTDLREEVEALHSTTHCAVGTVDLKGNLSLKIVSLDGVNQTSILLVWHLYSQCRVYLLPSLGYWAS